MLFQYRYRELSKESWLFDCTLCGNFFLLPCRKRSQRQRFVCRMRHTCPKSARGLYRRLEKSVVSHLMFQQLLNICCTCGDQTLDQFTVWASLLLTDEQWELATSTAPNMLRHRQRGTDLISAQFAAILSIRTKNYICHYDIHGFQSVAQTVASWWIKTLVSLT